MDTRGRTRFQVASSVSLLRGSPVKIVNGSFCIQIVKTLVVQYSYEYEYYNSFIMIMVDESAMR